MILCDNFVAMQRNFIEIYEFILVFNAFASCYLSRNIEKYARHVAIVIIPMETPSHNYYCKLYCTLHGATQISSPHVICNIVELETFGNFVFLHVAVCVSSRTDSPMVSLRFPLDSLVRLFFTFQWFTTAECALLQL